MLSALSEGGWLPLRYMTEFSCSPLRQPRSQHKAIDSTKSNDPLAQAEGKPFCLRIFRSEDVSSLYELDQICFRPGIAYSREDLQGFLFHPASVTVVAEDSRKPIIGFAILELYREKKQVIGHVITMDVHPERRRLGLGRQLMTSLEEIARKSGAHLLRLEVATDDKGAQAFYSRMGFDRVGRLKRYYLNKIDAFSLQRLLDFKLDSKRE